MSVKLTLSYETELELQEAKRMLKDKIQSIKIPKNQSGKFKKAYIILKYDCVSKKNVL